MSELPTSTTGELAAEEGSILRSFTFLVVWFGQTISILGSAMTGFALAVWTYRETGAVTDLAMLSLMVVLPAVLLSPICGVLVDRWDRRLVMLAADLGSALCTLALLLLLTAGRLEVWHLYVSAALTSCCSALQGPAYAAAISLLVPRWQLGRANGLVQSGLAVGQLLAPIVAGVLLVAFGIGSVLALDLMSFLVAVTALLLVRFPPSPRSPEGEQARGSVWREATFGLAYLRRERALLHLLLLFAVMNFLSGFIAVLGTPLILSTSSPAVLGVLSSIGGSGMLVGSLFLGVWGGPRRPIHAILWLQALSSACMILAGAIPKPVAFGVAAFIFFFTLPVVNGTSQALWQAKVAPDIQGRVFAIRTMVATSCIPLSYLCAGPLADRVFGPLMSPGGALASSVGRLLGTGPERGIGLLFIVLGVLELLVVGIGAFSPSLRRLDEDPPLQRSSGLWSAGEPADS